MSDDYGEVEQRLKLIPFTEKSSWQVWSKQFLARANIKGYKNILLEKEAIPTDAELKELDPKTNEGKDGKRLRKLNDQAYNDLLLCFSDVVNFGLVEDACTDSLTDGDSSMAWRNLVNKHEPSTKSNIVQLKSKFNTSKLTSGKKDPDEWISGLEVIRRKLKAMNHPISDMDMMIHVISNLPKEYDAITDQLEVELDGDTGSKIDMAEIRNRLRSKFNKLKRRFSKDEDDEDKNEKALSAAAKKGFKGRCSHCGKWGHKSADCRNKNDPEDKKEEQQDKKKFDGECFYCKKKGHRASECRKKIHDEKNKKNENANNADEKEKDDKKEHAMCTMEFCGFTSIQDQNLWIGDSGASSHMVNSTYGLIDVEDIDVNVEMGDGKIVKATKKGIFRGKVVQVDGSTTTVKLEVKYLSQLKTNLFSITTAMKNGAKLSNEGDKIILSKNGISVRFDRKASGGDGATMGAIIKPINKEPEVAMVTGAVIGSKKIDINQYHRMLGHVGEQKLRSTAKAMDVELQGKFEPCESCNRGKAKKKAIPKEASNRSIIPMERVYVDISSFTTSSSGGKKHWVLIVDDCTDMKWSYFIKRKEDLPETFMTFLKERDGEGKKVKIVRLDNAGENKALRDMVAESDKFRTIRFEFTAPRTPQQNGVVERAFPTIMGRARAMMIAAGFSKKMKQQMWAECIGTATVLENATVGFNSEASAVRLYGENYKWCKNLQEFGSMAVVTTKTESTGKLDDRGVVAMFVGYCPEHAKDTYRFIHLSTKKVIRSRDYKWLQQNWGEHELTKSNRNIRENVEIESDEDDFLLPDLPEEEEEDLDGEILHDIAVDAEDENPPAEPLPEQGGIPVIPVRAQRELGRLRTFYNPANYIPAVEEDPQDAEETAFVGATISDFGEPHNFDAAWNHKDPTARTQWREAIKKEYRDMLEKGVWRTRKTNTVTSGRKLIGTKWVFKLKKNGVYRARLVALGYSQVPGVDYTENFAPVVNDVTFRTLLVLYQVLKYDSRIIDVETAFLYGDLEEEIFMKIPSGFTECTGTDATGSCLELQRSLYGLVQAARQWWKKINSFLTEDLGFTCSEIDPCLLYRTGDSGTVYFCLYVDDVLCIGDTEAIEEAITEIKQKYSIKEIGRMHEYVGCTILPGDKNLHIVQPDLIKKLYKHFEVEVRDLSKFKTPGTPGEGVIRPGEDDTKISEELQATYRSGVGSLLYLMKHSRPDISNAVRELSKVMDGATPAHLKLMYRAIKYAYDTRQVSLSLSPKYEGTWKISGKSDSDYAGDKNTRQSVSGYVVYLNGALIAWKSKSQKTVTLSSTEAEYMALGELCTEVLFVKMLMENMGLQVDLPMHLEIDNTGAMFLAENATTSQRTKHIDVRHHFVRNLIKNGIIKVTFVKTSENDADLYTKNLSQELFVKHTAGYMKTIPYDYN